MEIYEKTLGSVLLFAGLAIIGYSIYSGVNVFLKAQDPPEIFKPIEIAKPADPNISAKESAAASPSKELPKNIGDLNPAELQKMLSGNINPADLQKTISGSLTPEMLRSVIPSEIFNYAPRLMNYSVYSLFLWVLVIAGGKVSAIGITLIKTNTIIKL